jgi:aspartyl-tRNA(Asn)/glutamyl-tRNA(Gln) amidotransferase subunit A
LHEKLTNGQITVQELLKDTKDMMDIADKKYNPFVTIIDKPELQENKESILNNIPYSAKDMFSTKGILTTGSSNTLKDYVPFFDATVIKKLKEKGAILTSKSAGDEFGLGATGTTCHTGYVRNPWDLKRQAGGSSSGSAALVAAGVVPFALGTDTGDSVRKPAAYCGIVGFKPTYGVISRYGVLPFAASLDHVGVLTRNVKDAAIVVDAIKGPDGKDMTALPEMEDFTNQINGEVSGKKLFYIKEICSLDAYENPDEELKESIKIFNETLEKCRNLGITIEEVSIEQKLLNAIYPSYMVISCAEATSNLSMYTGIIYGPRGVGTNINEMVKDYRTKGFSPLIKRRLVIGSYVLQKENQEKYYLNACRVRRKIIDTFNELFNNYDGFITLASGKGAPLFDDTSEVLTNKAVLENHLAIANFGGYPSITIPNGFVNGMPIGVNITGKVMDDANILNIAFALENTMPYKNQIGGLND